MFSFVLGLCLTILVPYVTYIQQATAKGSFRNEKVLHEPSELSETQISSLAALSSIAHMNEALDNICIVRAVGSPGHKTVNEYLKSSMRKLGWTVETDVFEDVTPNLGKLVFENIIAKLNPDARRYLVLACHYDSKYTDEENFVGATDSAVPCAQLLNLATVMQKQLQSAKTSDVSLMFIFFDGEEAFVEWDHNDSIYGARHLADKWHGVKRTYGAETDITDLDRMDMLILLDLLGAPDPSFCNYFSNTQHWYMQLMHAEKSLAKFNSGRTYFHPCSIQANIQDDHIPFLKKDVSIVHLIPLPFPSVWHTLRDNRSIVDLSTTEHLNRILRVFVASYLKLKV